MVKKDDDDVMNSTSNVVKTVVFFIVAIVVVTSLAIPVLANVGTRTITEDRVNTATNYGESWEYLSDVKEEFPDATYINFTASGITLSNGSTETIIVSGGELDASSTRPIALFFYYDAFQHSNVWGYFTFEFTTVPGYGDSYAYVEHQIMEDMTEWFVAYYPYGQYYGHSTHIESNGSYYIQNDDGRYIRTNHVFDFLTGQENKLVSYTMNEESDVVWVSDLIARYKVGSDGVYQSMNTAQADYQSTVYEEGISRSNGATVQGAYVEYTIAPREVSYEYTYTETTNILDGTIIQPLIGMIPLLLLIGVVLAVAKKMRMTDR